MYSVPPSPLISRVLSRAADVSVRVSGIKPAYRRGTSAGKAGVQFFGVLAAALIAVALL